MIFPDELQPDPCDSCGTRTWAAVICADGNRLHCLDCAGDCRICLADKDEARRVDAARKGE